MSELYEKSLAKLELDKVLEMLAECAGSEEAKTACRGLRPVSDLEDVKARAGGDHCRFGPVHQEGLSGLRRREGRVRQPGAGRPWGLFAA